jgi:ubiquinone/menaquinone biosynthesis C-methylase UbiE
LNNSQNYNNHIKHYITDAEVSDYFNPGPAEEQSIRRRYQYFKFLLSLKKEDMFCEIGSGGGEALNILKTSHCTYFPVDLSEKNLKIILEKSDTVVYPAVSDIFNLPYKDKVFDKMVASEVLEHLEDPVKALTEIYRVLKPGGLAVISVPNKEKVSYHLCIHCNQLTPANAHLHSFDMKKLATMCSQTGFRIVKVGAFANKLAQVLKMNLILKVLPFLLWYFVESMLNLFIPKNSHLMIILSRD